MKTFYVSKPSVVEH